jgi:hypothetical protein
MDAKVNRFAQRCNKRKALSTLIIIALTIREIIFRQNFFYEKIFITLPGHLFLFLLLRPTHRYRRTKE